MQILRIERLSHQQRPFLSGIQCLSSLAFSSFSKGRLLKGRSHKYIKREPYNTADGKRRYRYWYKMPNGEVTQHEDLLEGAAFSHPEGSNKDTSFLIVNVDDNTVTVRNEETQEEFSLSKEVLISSLAQAESERVEPLSSLSSTVDLVLKQPPLKTASSLDQRILYRQRNTLEDIESPLLQNPPSSFKELRTLFKTDDFKQLLEEIFTLKNGKLSFQADVRDVESFLAPKKKEKTGFLSGLSSLFRAKETIDIRRIEGDITESKVFVKGACARKLSLGDSELVLENESLELDPSVRGNSFSMQIYQRSEDFLASLTSNLPDADKAKIFCTMDASKDVGKYYWMTQGFQYKDRANAQTHLQSLRVVLSSLHKKLEASEYFDEEIPLLTTNDIADASIQDDPRPLVHNSLSDLHDAGITPQILKTLLNSLDQLEQKDTFEPWDLLALEEGLPRLMIKKENPEEEDKPLSIDCGPIKLAALFGVSWLGSKQIHPSTKKSQEGAAFAERRRALDASKAEKKGKPWTWLNLPS